jgi:hypothetical protein
LVSETNVDAAQVITVAESVVMIAVPLFEVLPAMVTASPTAKPSVTHEPRLRVIVVVAKTTEGAPVMAPPLASVSATRSVVSSVSTVAVTAVIFPLTLFESEPVTRM